MIDFGGALLVLRGGAAVEREGWNGSGMWVVLVGASDVFPLVLEHGVRHYAEPCFALFTAERRIQPGWLPSTADLLACDWQVVPHNRVIEDSRRLVAP